MTATPATRGMGRTAGLTLGVLSFLVALTGLAWACTAVSSPYLNQLQPNQGPAGTEVQVSGGNWEAGADVKLQWRDGDQNLEKRLDPVTAGEDGTFSTTFEVPPGEAGYYYVRAVQGGEHAQTPFEVTDPSSSGEPQGDGSADTTTSGASQPDESSDGSGSTSTTSDQSQQSSSGGATSTEISGGSSDPNGSTSEETNSNESTQGRRSPSSDPAGSTAGERDSDQTASSDEAGARAGAPGHDEGRAATPQPSDQPAEQPEPARQSIESEPAGQRAPSQPTEGAAAPQPTDQPNEPEPANQPAEPPTDEPSASQSPAPESEPAAEANTGEDPDDARSTAASEEAGDAGRRPEADTRPRQPGDPSARTGVADLWSGLEPGDGDALRPSLNEPVDGSDSAGAGLALAMGLLGGGVLLLLGGGLVAARRRPARAATTRSG